MSIRETEIDNGSDAQRPLAGKVAVVTAAGGAIDPAAVRALVEAGAAVVVTAPDEARLATVAGEIRAAAARGTRR